MTRARIQKRTKAEIEQERKRDRDGPAAVPEPAAEPVVEEFYAELVEKSKKNPDATLVVEVDNPVAAALAFLVAEEADEDTRAE
jgi:hypothetical protein